MEENKIIEKLGKIEKTIIQLDKKTEQLELDRKIDLKFNIFVSAIIGFLSAAVIASIFFIKQSLIDNNPLILFDFIVLIGTTIFFIATVIFVFNRVDSIRENMKKSIEEK